MYGVAKMRNANSIICWNNFCFMLYVCVHVLEQEEVQILNVYTVYGIFYVELFLCLLGLFNSIKESEKEIKREREKEKPCINLR